MSTSQKYQALTALAVVLGILFTATEVRTRAGRILNLVSEIRSKEEVTTESLTQEEFALKARESQLTSVLSGEHGAYEESETGVIEFLHESARNSGVQVESLVPSAVQVQSSKLKEIGITVKLSGGFHSVGVFLNRVENGPFTIRARKLGLSQDGSASRSLKAVLEATTVILSRERGS